jgi:hypothetical protein
MTLKEKTEVLGRESSFIATLNNTYQSYVAWDRTWVSTFFLFSIVTSFVMCTVPTQYLGGEVEH